MKTESVVVLATLVALAAAATYTNRFDNIDIEKILSNDRLLTPYIRCLLDEGPCTSEGRELKRSVPDALKTGCAKCTDKQRNAVGRVISYVRTHRSRDWDKLSSKFDPKGEYRLKYGKALLALE